MAVSFIRHIDGIVNLTDNVAADVIPSQGPNTRIVVTALTVTNSHATVSTKVEVRSGTTVRHRNYAVAGGGGYAPDSGDRPLLIGEPGDAITARCVTTGSDVDVSVSAYVIGYV